MGIKNLLQFLKPVVQKASIDNFSGCRVGVDAMCWMHRGACACAYELATGQDTDKFIRFFLRMVTLLLNCDISPVIVFDGDSLPAKAKEDEDRHKRRKDAQQEVDRLRKAGKTADDKEMQSKAMQAISVTGDMIDRVIEALRLLPKHTSGGKTVGVEVLVAPYEADAELAFLARIGYVEVVISEDSDLLAYGCPKVLYKLDKWGNGDLVDLSAIADLPDDGKAARKGKAGAGEGEGVGESSTSPMEVDEGDDSDQGDRWGALSSLRRWSHQRFVEFCILCGCDYTSDINIQGFGIKTAFEQIRQRKTIKRVYEFMRINRKWKDKLPEKKADFFNPTNRAMAVFLNHIVYHPQQKCMTSIATSLKTQPELPQDMDMSAVVGTAIDDPVEVHQLVSGRINPRTKKARATDTLSASERQLLKTFIANLDKAYRSGAGTDYPAPSHPPPAFSQPPPQPAPKEKLAFVFTKPGEAAQEPVQQKPAETEPSPAPVANRRRHKTSLDELLEMIDVEDPLIEEKAEEGAPDQDQDQHQQHQEAAPRAPPPPEQQQQSAPLPGPPPKPNPFSLANRRVQSHQRHQSAAKHAKATKLSPIITITTPSDDGGSDEREEATREETGHGDGNGGPGDKGKKGVVEGFRMRLSSPGDSGDEPRRRALGGGGQKRPAQGGLAGFLAQKPKTSAPAMLARPTPAESASVEERLQKERSLHNKNPYAGLGAVVREGGWKRGGGGGKGGKKNGEEGIAANALTNFGFTRSVQSKKK
ncbi:unnamed protein product [Vitrella brassicaformis CCMP3155]|uniref:Exonuclease 1 n=4 Tax=Vitrella brassicaformis TaxID=1169539 RepID=A0A0G4F378_VITBC|nr:unnamed protein product [Vitrella brassicaformis CCMP3155]|eukprot:CEM06514.1 unnamed protein product [Vitrella brassicaformis CCMP3155]